MNLSPKLVNALNAAISAAVGGAALAITQTVIDPSHVDLKHLGWIALVGAIIGLAQHYRTPPTITAQSAMTLQSTPSGQIAQAQNAVVEAAAAAVKAEAETIKDQVKG